MSLVRVELEDAYDRFLATVTTSKQSLVTACLMLCGMQAYLENNIGIVKLLLGELNDGALHVATAAKMEPGVAAFAYNVNLLNQMAVP